MTEINTLSKLCLAFSYLAEVKQLLSILTLFVAHSLSGQLSIVTTTNTTPGSADTIICNQSSTTFNASYTSGTQNIYWALVNAPSGVTLTPNSGNSSVTINWSADTIQQTIKFKVEDTTSTPVAIDMLTLIILPTAKMTLAQTAFCSNSPPFTIQGIAPVNGVLTISPNPSGLLSGNTVDPSKIAVPGTYTLTYSLTHTSTINGISTTCISTDSEQITIGGAPISLNFSTSTFEACGPAFSLLGTASPAGGSFAVLGHPAAILSNQLIPSQLSPGTYTLRYTYTDSFNCTTFKDQTITITGILLNGTSPNILVSDAGSVPTVPLSPSLFSGLQTFSICTAASSAIFQIQPIGLPSFTNYSINWGDGSPLSTGVFTSAIPFVVHQYMIAGIYPVTLTLSDVNGCSISSTFNLFYGSTQSLGLSTPGNTTVCLSPGTDVIALDFEISNWQNDPIGIQYQFGANDTSSSITVNAPLVNTSGQTAHPKLIYNPTSQKLFYRHFFGQSSCGTNSALGAATYNNSYSVSATKSSPCAGSQSSAAVAPIVVSKSPTSDIAGPDSTCTGQEVSFYDATSDGQMVSFSNGNYTCDQNAKGYWRVYPTTGVQIINPPLGSSNGLLNYPPFWTNGPDPLKVKFNRAGTFYIVRYIGLTGSGFSLCSIDSSIHQICVDSIPALNFEPLQNDTLCISDSLQVKFFTASKNCGASAKYGINAFQHPGNGMPSVSLAPTLDTLKVLTFQSSGKYVIEFISENPCGVNTAYDTLIILGKPEVNFVHDTLDFCNSISTVSIGTVPHELVFNLDYQVPTDTSWIVQPATGWTQTGTNSLGFPIYNFSSPGFYKVLLAFSNNCGIDTAVQVIHVLSNPNSSFSLVSDEGCSPFTPEILTASLASGTSHIWKLFDSSSAIPLQVVSGTGTLSSLPWNPFGSLINSSGVSVQTYSIRHLVSIGSNCLDSTTLTFDILPTPNISISIPSAVCSGGTYSILNNTVTSANPNFVWGVFDSTNNVWDSTILSNHTVGSPTITFPQFQYPTADRTYGVRLIATSAEGCSDTLTIGIDVLSQPFAQFDPIPNSCGPATIAVTNTSATNGPRVFSSFQWVVSTNLSNGSSATLSSPNAINPTLSITAPTQDSSLYTLKLIALDNMGCIDSTSREFWVYAHPVASLSCSTDSTCTPFNLNQLINTSNSGQTNSTTPTPGFYKITRIGIGGIPDTVYTSSTLETLPNFVLSNSGVSDSTYTIYLTVTNEPGCTSLDSLKITLWPNARAQINSVDTIGCAPISLNSSNVIPAQFPNANNGLTWTVKDFNNQVLFGPSANLNYTITSSNDSTLLILDATSLHGCGNDQQTIKIKTQKDPESQFSITPNDTICDGVSVTFNLQKPNTLNSYTWTSKYTGANRTTFSTLTYPIPFVVQNQSSSLFEAINIQVSASTSNMCADSSNKDLFVYPNPIPGTTVISGCYADSLTLVGASNNDALISTWEWNIGGVIKTGKSIKFKFASPGLYPVELTTTSIFGCIKSVWDTITAYDFPTANYSYSQGCGLDTLCVNTPITFTSTSILSAPSSPMVTYLWDIGADGNIDGIGSTFITTFSTIGQTNLKLTVEYVGQCSHDTIFMFEIIDKASVSVVFDDHELCGPTTPGFTIQNQGIIDSTHFSLYSLVNNSKVFLGQWSNTAPTLPLLQPSFDSDTIYYLEGTVYNCCGSFSSKDSVVILSPPIATALVYPDTGCSPLNVTFQLDNFVKGRPDSVQILFGDGTSASFSPTWITQSGALVPYWGPISHNYVNNGPANTFLATVTAYNECGDSTSNYPIYVEPNTSIASFTKTKSTGCAPLSVSFTNTSFNGPNVSWCFDYNATTKTCNGGSSNGNTANWIYSNPGTYNAAIFIDNGCSYDTAYQQITVYPSPSAGFSFNNNVCIGDTISFTSNSSMPSGWITGYQWDFGDGTSSMVQNPHHSYQSSGSFPVTLIITSPNGCQDSLTQWVIIQPSPITTFSVSNICLGDTANFINMSSISSGSMNGFFWDFGDGNTSNQFSPKHVYQAPGTYSTKLIVYSNGGCADSALQTVMVHPLPTLGFTPILTSGDSCNVPQGYTFNNSSTNSQQYYWDFDFINNPGLHTSTSNSPNFSFNSTGIFTIMLIGETGFGCRDTLFQDIVVRDGVIGRFTIDTLEGCQPLLVTFTDSSIFDSNLDSITEITWNFGDGVSIVQGSSPWVQNHTYTGVGSYIPSYTVKMESSCTSIFQGDPIQVYPQVTANFTINRINSTTRSFQNLTQSNDSISKIKWTFGDGSTSYDHSPNHEYDPSIIGQDSVKVCLSVETLHGCADSICQNIWIWPAKLHVPNAFAPGLDYVGEDNLFLPKGNSLISYELIIYDSWGNEVWRTTELTELGMPKIGWDGKNLNGLDCPMGVYAWTIRAIFDTGERWLGQEDSYGRIRPFGTLNLIR